MRGVLGYMITTHVSVLFHLDRDCVGLRDLSADIEDAQWYATNDKQRREMMRKGEALLTVIHPWCRSVLEPAAGRELPRLGACTNRLMTCEVVVAWVSRAKEMQ